MGGTQRRMYAMLDPLGRASYARCLRMVRSSILSPIRPLPLFLMLFGWHLHRLCEPGLSRKFCLVPRCSFCLSTPRHVSLQVQTPSWALKVTPAPEQPVPATIALPDPSPWTTLAGRRKHTRLRLEATPVQCTHIWGCGFDADFDTMLENPNLPLGYSISGMRSVWCRNWSYWQTLGKRNLRES
jgi:hypothetical protein